MDYLTAKAKKNNWELQNNCCGKTMVYVPFNESAKIIQHLTKTNANFSTRCNHDFTLRIISFI